MSNHLLFLLLNLGIFAPLLVSFAVRKMTNVEQARRWTAWTLALSFAALLCNSLAVVGSADGQLSEPFSQWFLVDALNAIPLSLFAALCLGVTVLAPKHNLTPQWLAGILLLSATTCATYAANNLVIFVFGWAGSLAPFLVTRDFALPSNASSNESGNKAGATIPGFSKVVLVLSLVSLCTGVGLLIYSAPEASWSQALGLTLARTGDSTLLFAAFAFLMGAVVLRKGLFPAHSWVATAFERGPLLPLTLLLNGHLGAFLVARVVLPLLPDEAHQAWPIISALSLLTAAYVALIGLVERKPRRLFALVAISQSAFLLAGLESYSAIGIAGALVLWQVVAVSTTMLASVYAGLEARLGAALEKDGYLGLAVGAPRLAVFFAVGGLALVGLPLTLGFPAEDLLLQGTLATNPYLGVVLPVVTAINAFSIVRLFARLFLGSPIPAANHITDALPRERWVLIAALLFLVLGGLFPAQPMRLPAIAAERLMKAVPGLRHTAQLP
ncbi:MAG: proton-conducting transporter membrane subunit [Blastocatellia bacterium]